MHDRAWVRQRRNIVESESERRLAGHPVGRAVHGGCLSHAGFKNNTAVCKPVDRQGIGNCARPCKNRDRFAGVDTAGPNKGCCSAGGLVVADRDCKEPILRVGREAVVVVDPVARARRERAVASARSSKRNFLANASPAARRVDLEPVQRRKRSDGVRGP